MHCHGIIGAVSNALRGGQFDKYWRKLPHDYINAAIFGLLAWCVTADIWALALAPFMFLGATLGWGSYIGAMTTNAGIAKEVGFIDFLICPFKRWPHLWGCLGLSLRGLFWGACLSLGFALIGHPNYWFMAIGTLMGCVYIIGYGLADVVEGKGWPISEWLFGALLWSAL